MIGPNKLYDIVITGSWAIDKITKLKPKFIKTPLKYIVEMVTKYRIIGLLEGYSIERILYEFAQFSYAFNIVSNQFNYIRKYIEVDKFDPTLFGIDYKVLSNNKEYVTGIYMDIWTEDRMAKLKLELSFKYGQLNLNVVWAYKNEDGIFMTYNRSDPILDSREEIKEILVEYLSKYCLYFLYYCEKISPSR